MLDAETRSQFESALLSSCFTEPNASAPFLAAEILSGRGRRMLAAIRDGIAADGLADVGLVTAAIHASNSDSRDALLHLADLIGNQLPGRNAKWYAARLTDDYRRRTAALEAECAATAITEGDYSSAVEHLEVSRDALSTTGTDTDTPVDIAAVLAREATPPVPWAVSGLFAKGDIVVIGGEGGTGKSILALDLAIALATAQPLFDMRVPEPQPVLYLDEENQAHIIERRIRQHLLGREITQPPDGLTYYRQCGHSLHSPESRARVSALVDRHKPAWVVLDSLIRFLGGADENSNTDAAQFSATLKGERNRAGVGWIVLAHLAKPSKDRPDAVHRIRGAGEFVNNSDALLTLEGDRDSDRRTLTPQQRRTSTLAAMGIRWAESEDQETARLVSLGGETSSAEQIIRRALQVRGEPGMLRQEIVDLLEAQGYADSKRTVSRALGKMTGQGTVSTEKEGRVVRVRLLTHSNH